MKRLLVFTVLTVFFIPIAAQAFDGDGWIVAGDRVRVRQSPSSGSAVVAETNAGTVVRVTEKSKSRDKFLPGDDYGFFWYNCVLPGGKRGWIYGKFLYQMNGESFLSDAKLLEKEYRIGGKRYLFGVAIEEAYPISDAREGLTGSVIHGLPFFVQEDGDQAMLLRTKTVRTFEDTDLKLPYYFKVTDSEGGIQKVSSIDVDGKDGTVRISFEFSLQDGGGNFTITAKPVGGLLLISDYKLTMEPNE